MNEFGVQGPRPHETRDRFSLSRPEDRRIFPLAFCAALVLHLLCCLIDFPESKLADNPQEANTRIVVRKYIPPPPRPKRPRSSTTRKKAERKIPVPDPTPDYPEPIAEPEPDLSTAPVSFDAEFSFGAPEPPPGPGSAHGTAGGTGPAPLMAGVGGVTNPVRIEGACPPPRYPELARVARVTGEVILRAVILCDGSVAESEVLRCTTPGFGFEDEAIAAVEKWHYLPAKQDGTPVAVYFTIIVDFDLV
jgi:protein TonB